MKEKVVREKKTGKRGGKRNEEIEDTGKKEKESEIKK